MQGQYRYSAWYRLPCKLEHLANSRGKQRHACLASQLIRMQSCSRRLRAGRCRTNRTYGLQKEEFPNLYYVTDVCMCEYTSHGHCGMLCGETVDNDSTLPVLAKTALSHVQAGADMVAPSDMMDGRIVSTPP